MKIKINNKVFDATMEGNTKAILEAGLNDNDMLYFTQWMDKSLKSEQAHQYKKDLHFATDTKKGLLYGCFPIVSSNDKIRRVEINIDHFKYN